jgi:hypothetical protein
MEKQCGLRNYLAVRITRNSENQNWSKTTMESKELCGQQSLKSKYQRASKMKVKSKELCH